ADAGGRDAPDLPGAGSQPEEPGLRRRPARLRRTPQTRLAEPVSPGRRKASGSRSDPVNWLSSNPAPGWRVLREEKMTTTRRSVLQTGAAATAMLAAPFVRGAHAAGKLTVAFWDHWVPGANAPLQKLCEEWADKEKVELKVDFIASNGDKDLLTVAAESQAKSGHDLQSFTAWYAPGY